MDLYAVLLHSFCSLSKCTRKLSFCLLYPSHFWFWRNHGQCNCLSTLPCSGKQRSKLLYRPLCKLVLNYFTPACSPCSNERIWLYRIISSPFSGIMLPDTTPSQCQRLFNSWLPFVIPQSWLGMLLNHISHRPKVSQISTQSSMYSSAVDVFCWRSRIFIGGSSSWRIAMQKSQLNKRKNNIDM